MTTLTFNYGYWEFWADYDPANGYYGDQTVVFDGDNKLIYISPSVFEITIRDDLYSNWKEWTLVRDNGKYAAAMRATGGDLISASTGQFLGDVYFLINGWRIVIDHNCKINGVIYSDDFDSPFIQSNSTQLVTNVLSAYVQTYAPVITDLNLPTSTENATAVWDYVTRTLTSPSGPTSTEIRQEIDANSTRLSSIETKVDGLPALIDSAESVWNYATRTLTSPSGPTSTEIRQEIDANSTRLSSIETKVDSLPTAATISQEVWNYTLRELTTTMTPEQFWNFLLTVPLTPGSAGAKLKETLTNNNFLALK